MLRCVFCGFCVDACPKDAIWMSRNYELAFFTRQEAVFGIDKLVEKPGRAGQGRLRLSPLLSGRRHVPPTDASAAPVVPGDGERAGMRIEGTLPAYRPGAPQVTPS